MLYTGGYYTGNVSFGGSERRLALLDFNGNGLFNEYFEPRAVGPTGRLYAMGDQVLIDVNGDGRFSPGTDSDELYPCARCFRVDGEWYSLDISDCGSEVDVQRPDLKLGTIKIPAEASSCSLMLACSEGILKVQAGQEVQVPVDTYQVYYHSTEIQHSSGRWRYDAYGSTAGKKFRVAEGSSVTVEFGAPLLVNVRSETRPGGGNRARAGNTVNISLELSGQGGEIYTNISLNNGRPPAPTFKALDEKGNVVAKGDFKYG
jgi:hypothetical protein